MSLIRWEYDECTHESRLAILDRHGSKVDVGRNNVGFREELRFPFVQWHRPIPKTFGVALMLAVQGLKFRLVRELAMTMILDGERPGHGGRSRVIGQ